MRVYILTIPNAVTGQDQQRTGAGRGRVNHCLAQIRTTHTYTHTHGEIKTHN